MSQRTGGTTSPAFCGGNSAGVEVGGSCGCPWAPKMETGDGVVDDDRREFGR